MNRKTFGESLAATRGAPVRYEGQDVHPAYEFTTSAPIALDVRLVRASPTRACTEARTSSSVGDCVHFAESTHTRPLSRSASSCGDASGAKAPRDVTRIESSTTS